MIAPLQLGTESKDTVMRHRNLIRDFLAQGERE